MCILKDAGPELRHSHSLKNSVAVRVMVAYLPAHGPFSQTLQGFSLGQAHWQLLQ